MREKVSSISRNLNESNIPHNSREYQLLIRNVDRIAKFHQIDMRIVGGSITDLLSLSTKYQIDPLNRKIIFNNYPSHSDKRSDGSYKDIDAICFCPNINTIDEFRRDIKGLLSDYKKLNSSAIQFSVEPAFYHDNPGWGERNPYTQFVSSIDVYNNQPYLQFGSIKQKVSWQSFEPWSVYLSDELDEPWITSLGPFPQALRYCMRMPSGVKDKDKKIKVEDGIEHSKMSLLMRMAVDAKKAGRKVGIDYLSDDYYGPWLSFIREMHNSQDINIRFKRWAGKTFWNTIGDKVSHHTVLNQLSNLFTG